VIIPTYNRAHCLNEAIDSVLSQDFRDYELIVVDDGSTDATQEILGSYDGTLRLICQRHGGVSAARNRGIAHARGGFVAFLDSDDLWLPKKLSVQVDFFRKHPDALICQTEEIWIRNGVRVNSKKRHRKYSGDIFEKALPLCIVSPSAVMMKRSLFDKVGLFDKSFPVCEDYDLWLRVSAAYPVHLIETPLIVKRGGHSDQLSRSFLAIDRFRIKALCKILTSGSLHGDQERLAIDALERKCGIYGRGCLKRGRIKEGRKYLDMPKAFREKSQPHRSKN
ncbi:MAG: glycosyltransferase, partial [Proteobacteria bacterium]|nr:glycosyltransferase [Pseudomonadota bacterium]